MILSHQVCRVMALNRKKLTAVEAIVRLTISGLRFALCRNESRYVVSSLKLSISNNIGTN